MQPVLRLMERVGPSDANALITGEHGTGKEVVARWLHAAVARAGRPMVTVNLGGLAEGVFESELFGHVQGCVHRRQDRPGRAASSWPTAARCSSTRSRTCRSRSRRSCCACCRPASSSGSGSSKTRHVDVRILSATNADLRAEVAAGRFREDLLFRLNTIEIHLPPLRERREDIPPLAAHFLGAVRGALPQDRSSGFHPDAMRALLGLRAGPATCASWTTRSSARCCWPQATRSRAGDLNLRPTGRRPARGSKT